MVRWEIEREREREMVSRYLLIRDWVLILVVQLCLVRCSADYFWDGTGWKWQESPGGETEGSGGDLLHEDEEEEDFQGSAGGSQTDFDIPLEEDSQVDKDIINVDDEIDDIGDIGFHEDTSTISPPSLTSVKAAVTTGPTEPGLPGDPADPHKQLNQETNFFAQPGILTGQQDWGLVDHGVMF